ncbi:hypothetical protein NQ317_008649 [Molorchus minor]|uniref:Uncharacterized protein n=1 Tax=Molorchus minor TaxID=1323400 RepID=A0ABQ9K2Z3_9CUCU|nr:hypothetical protein NQ317_008649 [Molorchus minor]
MRIQSMKKMTWKRCLQCSRTPNSTYILSKSKSTGVLPEAAAKYSLSIRAALHTTKKKRTAQTEAQTAA